MNLVQENEKASSASIDCNFIDVEHDSEPEYGVLQLESAIRINRSKPSSQAEENPGSSVFSCVQVTVFLFNC